MTVSTAYRFWKRMQLRRILCWNLGTITRVWPEVTE